MPRDGSGIYSVPIGTAGVPNTTISSTKYNNLIADLVQDANAPRPVTAGGTGATNASGAQASLDIPGAVATKMANGTPVGTTTAAEGRFTTLAATSQATFTNGSTTVPSVSFTSDPTSGWSMPSVGVVADIIGGVERARWLSGTYVIGKSVTSIATAGIALSAAGLIELSTNGNIGLVQRRLNTDGGVTLYQRDGNSVGSVSVTNTATSFNTSSDYRLKGSIQDLEGSGTFIDALRPREWIWHINGERGVGFIAHEAQEVSPSSVMGVKDGEDAYGPSYQAMQASSPEIMAHIIGELQALRLRVAELEAAA